MSDVIEVITVKTASLLSSVVEGNEACADPFARLEEDAEELENDKLAWMSANYECIGR